MDLPSDVLDQVERRLDVRLDRSTVATGAWAETAGHRTDRGTWVRVDSRPVTGIQPQAWIGAEAASVIPDVPKPAWLQSSTWRDHAAGTVWRAQEMELVTDPVIAPGSTPLTHDPQLPASWWSDLRTALAALAAFRTPRVAAPQELITRRISQVFGDDVHRVDTTVTEWTTAHGDLHWGNITAPALTFLDWGDWGLAPRGADAACLWASSLAVPALADRVLEEFGDDLNTRAGRIARLWVVSNIVRIGDRRPDAGALVEQATKASAQLLTDLG